MLMSLIGAAAPGAEPGSPSVLPTERKRYADPTTEFEVLRLTEPVYSSFLPPAHQRPIAKRNGFLVYASDRTGSLQALRMDLKTGSSTVLTSVAALVPHSLCLSPDERTLYFADGRWLCAVSIGSRRLRRLFQTGGEVTSLWAGEGGRLLMVESWGGVSRLRLAQVGGNRVATLVETPGSLADPMLRPKRPVALYRKDSASLWLIQTDGKHNRRLETPEGRIGRAYFSPDGHSVLYLHAPPDASKLPSIRELDIETGEDRQVAVTSRFVDFAPNFDASVFAGVSGSLAQPTILLLVRAVRRELTLCEHRASDPTRVHAQFTPTSQRMLFQSDRHGKPAIYMMNIERLVEKTETE